MINLQFIPYKHTVVNYLVNSIICMKFSLEREIENYLLRCEFQKKLSPHSQRAYRIDLLQFLAYISSETNGELNRENISQFILKIQGLYKSKTVKRKIASLRAFFNNLVFEELLEENPLTKIDLRFRESFVLPKIIALSDIQKIFETLYSELEKYPTSHNRYELVVRDITILEVLFSTGIRISELCSLTINDINLETGKITIHGKGSKERLVYIGNNNVLSAIRKYYSMHIKNSNTNLFLFTNKQGKRLSEQSVRHMIGRYAKEAGVKQHITPHMFRHSFATLLLDEGVDIRQIQNILGHASIVTTQIYTHVSSNKQREILTEKNPRNKLHIKGL